MFITAEELRTILKQLEAATEDVDDVLRLQLSRKLQMLMNCTADVHTSALKAEVLLEEKTEPADSVIGTSNALNCQPFTLTRRDGEEEHYLLPVANSPVGKVMRELLTSMEQNRDPMNKITLKEFTAGGPFREGCDGSCIEVLQDKTGDFLHELISR